MGQKVVVIMVEAHSIAFQCKAVKVVKQVLIRERLDKKHDGYHGGVVNQV